MIVNIVTARVTFVINHFRLTTDNSRSIARISLSGSLPISPMCALPTSLSMAGAAVLIDSKIHHYSITLFQVIWRDLTSATIPALCPDTYHEIACIVRQLW